MLSAIYYEGESKSKGNFFLNYAVTGTERGAGALHSIDNAY